MSLDPQQLIQILKAQQPALGGPVEALMMRQNSAMQSHLGGNILQTILQGPLQDAHDFDAAAVEFDQFVTGIAATDAGVITGIVNTAGGTDLTLYAQTSAQSESGVIIIDPGASMGMSQVTAGTGSSLGWGVVSIPYGLTSPGVGFQSIYDAMPSTFAYNTSRIFAHDLCRLRAYKPLHGLTIESGGPITCRMIVRPLGPTNGITVVWPGATMHSISPQACNLIQRMVRFEPENYGPLNPSTFFGVNKLATAPGRKVLARTLFGGGQLTNLLGNLGRGLGLGALGSHAFNSNPTFALPG